MPENPNFTPMDIDLQYEIGTWTICRACGEWIKRGEIACKVTCDRSKSQSGRWKIVMHHHCTKQLVGILDKIELDPELVEKGYEYASPSFAPWKKDRAVWQREKDLDEAKAAARRQSWERPKDRQRHAERIAREAAEREAMLEEMFGEGGVG